MRKLVKIASLGSSLAALLAFALAAHAEDARPKIDHAKLVKAGTVSIEEYEVGIGLADAVWGHGEVEALGEKRRFRISGMGAGAGGAAKISATGTVYNLKDFGLFAGLYSEGGAGAVAADKSASTSLWLVNTNGVVLELKGTAKGLAVTGGAQGILVQFDR